MARAFARQAWLLILDEPTAHLDARAEYQLFTRFKEFSRGRTTLLISHRSPQSPWPTGSPSSWQTAG